MPARSSKSPRSTPSAPEDLSLAPAAAGWTPPEVVVARANLDARQPAPPSLLERLFQLLIADPRWRVSFDDLSGLLGRVPDLQLPIEYLMHTCAFCQCAKSNALTAEDCSRNKHAVNRLLLYRHAGLAGPCHLGLTDIVEPLIVGGRTLGVFYCGSVVLQGSRARVRLKIIDYCRRRRMPPDLLLQALAHIPEAAPAELESMRARLRAMIEVVLRVMEPWGGQIENVKVGVKSSIWLGNRALPLPLRLAMEKLRLRYSEPLELQALAGELKVSPDYLGRLFKRHLGATFSEYLAQLRIDHARRLLGAGFSPADVACRTGFADQAHFGRTFKRLAGLTPGGFIKSVK